MASTPQTVSSSPAGSPEALTIMSSSSQQTPQTISSDPPELAFVGEVIQIPEEDADEQSTVLTQGHVSSSSEDVEVLEARVATARAARREAEALEKLHRARARRSRTQSSRSSISSARLNTQAREHVVVSDLLDLQAESAPAQPAHTSQPVTTVHAQASQPVLPVQAPSWLDWFERHTPLPGRGPTQAPSSAEPPGSGGQHAFLEQASTHARAQAQTQESARVAYEHERDEGKGVASTLGERDWQLHRVQARVLELELLLE